MYLKILRRISKMSRMLLISCLVTLVIVGVRSNTEDDFEAIICKKVSTPEGQKKLQDCEAKVPKDLKTINDNCKKELGLTDTSDMEMTKKCCNDKDLGKKLHECNAKAVGELMKTKPDFMKEIEPVLTCIKA